MNREVKVLDYGYVKLIETWGSDERIIEAARMSTDKGFQGWGPTAVCSKCGSVRVERDSEQEHPGIGTCATCGGGCYIDDKPGDEKLLRFLYEHKHFTPFEMGGITVEAQAPIFVFREWHRHRTQSYNELSARYTPMPDVNYVPTLERLLLNADGTNKQAGTVSGATALTEFKALEFQAGLRRAQELAEHDYQVALISGVPKELARCFIPVSRFSRMRASANLRNWLHFLSLRMDPAAQWEIRQYANVVGQLIADAFPRTWELFQAGK